MAIAAWPAQLPDFVLQDGYGLTFGDARLMTRPDGGPPKARRRFSRSFKMLTVQILCEADQIARLDSFWEVDLVGGTKPFTMRDYMFDEQDLADEDGVVLEDEDDVVLDDTEYKLVQFSDGNSPPSVAPSGGLSPSGGFMYRVVLNLTVIT